MKLMFERYFLFKVSWILRFFVIHNHKISKMDNNAELDHPIRDCKPITRLDKKEHSFFPQAPLNYF
jgi:hypothetical protein